MAKELGAASAHESIFVDFLSEEEPKKIEFSFDVIAFTTNNEVALLYPSHPNSEYFREVSDVISKCCLKEAFTRALTQYNEYLDIGITTFKNAARAHYVSHSSMYVPLPFTTIVRPWFATIGYSRNIGEKSCLPPRWRLLMGQIIQCLGGKTGGLYQISKKDATILYCLVNEVKVDYAKLIWEDIIHKLNKKTREKVIPYPSFFHFHSKSAFGCDASADSTAEADPRIICS
nr:hypothetical protein [Tanacetum cinerariifolium]